MMIRSDGKKRVVVVGGGFAGVELMKQLRNDDRFEAILVDLNNYYFFPPLIYQVATGFMEPSAISYPFRKILRGRNNSFFRMGELQKIVPEENRIVLDNGELNYDLLVIATGTESNFFGMDRVKESAIPMKNISDALAMRNFILNNLEKASRSNHAEEKRQLLNIVIAGAGPTGVELAGMFSEMRQNILAKDYPELMSDSGAGITLVDGSPAVLSPMSEKSQRYSYEQLTKLGVKIILNTTVKDYVNNEVILSDGSAIKADNLIWTAGVTSKVFEGLPKEAYGRGRRLIVDAFNKVQGFENIYALGDTCLLSGDPGFPDGHPQMAQPAIQQAANLGKNLKRTGEWKPFTYKDKGSMAIIGRNKAVADIPKSTHLNGFPAWFIWVFVHIMSLVNYRNRVKSLYNWIGAYFTKDQSFRMIIRPRK